MLSNLNELVLEAKRAQGLGLVLLDACRNNPFADRMAAELGRAVVGRGLTRIESTPSNVLVSFATKEDAIAPDNSHYARALLKYLPEKNLEIRLLMGSVRDEVMDATGKRQEPYTYGTLGRKQWFLAGQVKPKPNPDPRSEPVTPPLPLQDAVVTPPRRQAFEPDMVLIKGGRFLMGSPASEKGRYDDEKQHQVTLKDFWIGKTEVTFAQWDACVDDSGCSHKPDDKGWGRGQRPVINVSWQDANQYVGWLTKKTGKTYRLPTEAEWEYAARAGRKTAYAWGNTINCALANYGFVSDDCKTDRTKPVASYKAYGGLYDMHGNVYEWTCSAYEKKYDGSENLCANTNDSRSRVLRGGSWYNLPLNVRSATRGRYNVTDRDNFIGFRLARTR